MIDDDVKIIPFCVPFSSIDDVDSAFGIVGTITLRGRSAVVWFGWGAIEPAIEGGDVGIAMDAEGVVSVGNGRPPMGSLELSMPPVIQNSRPERISSTQLLGGSSEGDMILGHQISERLAKRIGWPIFVSCSLGGWAGDASGTFEGGYTIASPASSMGYDDSMQRHTTALAEREVSRILLRQLEHLDSNIKTQY